MSYIFTPLSENQADNLFLEINSLLEAEFQNESQPKIGKPNLDVLPTKETFDKAEVLKCLRILEPNSIIFFQDLQVCITVQILLFYYYDV